MKGEVDLDTNMPLRFREIESQLPGLLAQLLACPPHTAGARPPVPRVGGVYLFSQNGRALYVGRTRNCNRRLADHTRASTRENSAPFAFNLARRALAQAGEQVMGTRTQVAAHPTFGVRFSEAKRQLRQMEFRFVEIQDPALSTIFEVYASIALRTEGEYNLFETH